MGWRAAGLGLAISAVSLYLAARQVRPAETAGALLGAHPALLLLGLALLRSQWRCAPGAGSCCSGSVPVTAPASAAPSPPP